MSKKNIYVSPSMESVDVDSDIIVCNPSGSTGGDSKPGGGEEIEQPDPEDEIF